MRRIWTYQEIILATDPTILCGHNHLKLSRLTWSILFLDCLRAHVTENAVAFSGLAAWKDIVFTRAGLTASNIADAASTNPLQLENVALDRLRIYQRFIHVALNRCDRSLCIIIFIEECCFFSIIFGLAVSFLTSYTGRFFTSLFLCGALVFTRTHQIYMIPRLNGMEILREHFYETPRPKLVHAITSREARDPRDKAFAVRAILQRLSSDVLPTPDLWASVGEIYRELCFLLVRISGSFDLLVMAALKSYPGQPSWIPDWTTTASNRLLQPFNFRIRNDLHPYSPPSFWQLNNCDVGALTIWGHQIGTLSSCLKFETTKECYLDSECEYHLTNLKAVLLLVDNLYFIRESRFPELSPEVPILHSASRFSLLGGYRQIVSWSELLYCLRRKCPSEILDILLRKRSWTPFKLVIGRFFGFSPKYPNLATHFAVCNHMAENRQISLSLTIESEMFRSLCKRTAIVGTATNDVQVGDKVVLFSGLSCPLIVRGEPHATRLVSAIRMNPIHCFATKSELDFCFSKDQQQRFRLI